MISAKSADRPPEQAGAREGSDESRLPPYAFALKQGDTFLIADACGDIDDSRDGLFRDDTRVLSRYRLTLAGKSLARLSAAISPDNVFFVFHGTNRPLPALGEQGVPQGVVHIMRRRFLWQDRLYERIMLENFGDHAITAPLRLEFDADFRDIFEVRGFERRKDGRHLPVDGDPSTLRYRGADGVLRTTHLAFSVSPARLTAGRAEFDINLAPRGRSHVFIEVGSDDSVAPGESRYRLAAAKARVAMRLESRRGASLRCLTQPFDDWLQKSRADLALLTTTLETGPYPYAGVPWFSTPFGRDAIITALQMLWLDPALARGVLAFLAKTQARTRAPFQAAEPGKILHEMRRGEMSAIGEVPYGRYYGAADTTPLFVILAEAYVSRTADVAFIERIWPSLLAAMGWLEEAGASDGFLNYKPNPGGLVNQGWKDSDDSVFHADGRLARGPIAMVEVQGYAYRAFRAMARLAERRGDLIKARHCLKLARQLRAAVENRFWMEDRRFYALAIDGEGEPCRVAASNAGHLLYCGLPTAKRGADVADRLLSADFNSGWGIRTLGRGERRFNPISYHNGSVWPHDTALCAAGLARYGRRPDTLRLLEQMFEAARYFGMQLPELFCGFERDAGQSPVTYPVACLPQAWAAGSAFMLLQASLGIHIDGFEGAIHIDRPALPRGIDCVEIGRLALGGQTVSLRFLRLNGRVAAEPIGSSDVPIYVRA